MVPGTDSARPSTFSIVAREPATLEGFRATHNFENHSVDALEDALARGWGDAEWSGADRLVDAVWHGLSHRERR
jgi:hypothetical protein